MRSYAIIKFGLIIALFLTLIILLTCYFLELTTHSYWFLKMGLLVFFSSFIVSTLVFYWYVKSRIQNLYKLMESYKKSNNKLTNKDFIEHVENDVIIWANRRRDEIEKLKETEEYRREFIGNLAHELKTPVFSVQGYILTLLEGGLEDENINRKFLQKAFKGIERIATVINDMDTITGIESGTLELNMEKFDLVNLIDNVFYELEEKANKKNVTLFIENKNGATCFVIGDQSKITQVVYNLVNNSINYGNENGETKITIKPHKEKIQVLVSDNGPGIEKIHHDRLFERFYRVEKSRNRNKGGSGIGLAIVKHIIEAHSETISVDSEVGIGTTFLFHLPKAKS